MKTQELTIFVKTVKPEFGFFKSRLKFNITSKYSYLCKSVREEKRREE